MSRLRLPAALALATAALMSVLPALSAAAAGEGRPVTWADWWLPKDYSAHGPSMDWLFNVIFWITMIIFVVVEVLIVYFAIKYRYRPGRKGVFSHGNTRLEMAWTIAPAIVLLWISLATKRVWDEYRYGNKNDGPRTPVMVIGQQFKWNFIYPGPDGKLGRYMSYPKPTDPRFVHKPAEAAARDVAAELQANPLGQRVNPDDPADPALDDDYVANPGRPLIIPRDRPLDMTLGSRDVLHSFFLPNFRVKLDAVPGLRGQIFFTAKTQSTKTAKVELVPEDKLIWLDSSTPKAFVFSNPPTYQVFDPKVTAPDASDPYAVDPNTLDVAKLTTLTGARSRDPLKRKQPWLQSLETSLRDGAIRRLRERALVEKTTFDPLTAPPEVIAREVMALRQDLLKMGIAELAYVDETFEIVCEELCGGGHSLMTGQMIVVSGDQYDRFINKLPPGKAPVAAAAPAPATPGTQPLATTQPEATTQPNATTQPDAATQPTTAPTIGPATVPATQAASGQ